MTEPETSSQPSKSALKKAAKAAEKVKKKAEKSAKLQDELQHRQREEAVDEFNTENYGEQPSLQTTHHDWVQFNNIDKYEDQLCIFRCVVENARIQSAKLVFLTLSQGLESIQTVVFENREEGVSKAMVRFAGNIPPESVCTVFGIVKRTSEKIKSTTVQSFEVHAKKIYILSKAQVPLPLQPADSERPLPLEEMKETSGEDEGISGPLVSLNTRLNNRVLDLRAKINHCIFIIKDGVDSLFQEFLHAHHFIRIHTPKILGAASEGEVTSYKFWNDYLMLWQVEVTSFVSITFKDMPFWLRAPKSINRWQSRADFPESWKLDRYFEPRILILHDT